MLHNLMFGFGFLFGIAIIVASVLLFIFCAFGDHHKENLASASAALCGVMGIAALFSNLLAGFGFLGVGAVIISVGFWYFMRNINVEERSNTQDSTTPHSDH